MRVDASSDAAVTASLIAEEERVWRELLPLVRDARRRRRAVGARSTGTT
jgi:hypothetical protein